MWNICLLVYTFLYREIYQQVFGKRLNFLNMSKMLDFFYLVYGEKTYLNNFYILRVSLITFSDKSTCDPIM